MHEESSTSLWQIIVTGFERLDTSDPHILLGDLPGNLGPGVSSFNSLSVIRPDRLPSGLLPIPNRQPLGGVPGVLVRLAIGSIRPHGLLIGVGGSSRGVDVEGVEARGLWLGL